MLGAAGPAPEIAPPAATPGASDAVILGMLKGNGLSGFRYLVKYIEEIDYKGELGVGKATFACFLWFFDVFCAAVR